MKVYKILFHAESFTLVIQKESHGKNEPGRNNRNKLRNSRNKCKYVTNHGYAKQTSKREQGENLISPRNRIAL